MPTRRVDESSEHAAQERFMSSTEYVARRGVLANAVAAKAQLYRSAAHRSLLFFLQGLSMDNGGLRAVARELFDMFPDRIVTCDSNALTQEQRQEEMAAWLAAHGDDCVTDDEHALKARWFAEFLERLCIDPAIDLEEISANKVSPDAPYFRDPVGAILEYRKRQRAELLARTAVTSIGSEVHRWLDRALSARRMIVIEGGSGAGKTHAAELWCRLHLGEARFVTLSGITHRTGLFQKIGSALGLAICQHASSKLQAKVEAHLESTKLMLVIDEAHQLWPAHKRTHSPPELIDWINTLVNMGVPVALICTDQFAKRKSHVEKQTGWTADQFIHRTWLKETIEERPTKSDLRAVARSLLSYRWSEALEQWVFDAGCCPDPLYINAVALYAEANLLPLPSIRSIIDETRVLANERGSNNVVVSARDIKQALESRQRSDVAIRAAFGGQRKAPRRRTGALLGSEPTEKSPPSVANRLPIFRDGDGTGEESPVRLRSTPVTLRS
jgi:hypothetical protein